MASWLHSGASSYVVVCGAVMSIFSVSDGPAGRRSLITNAYKFTYIDLPDLGLNSLQARFQGRELESLYKRYEQRAHIGNCNA